MDAFEQIVAKIFEQQGFWTKIGYKVTLTNEQKRFINNPSIPRSEIDILAYRPSENLLLWVECKSYLDSRGVTFSAFNGEKPILGNLFKIFNKTDLREIVSKNLISQLKVEGLLSSEPQLKFCLVTGKIATKLDRSNLHRHFETQGWILYDEYWVKQGIMQLSEIGYENDITVITAKLFARIGDEGPGEKN